MTSRCTLYDAIEPHASLGDDGQSAITRDEEIEGKTTDVIKERPETR